MTMDWRVKTPSIAGPMQGASVPLTAFWLIVLIVGMIFMSLHMFFSGLTAVGMSFTAGLVLWCLASARTRQDKDWIAVAIEKSHCRVRMYALYLWNKHYYWWPV